MSEEATGEAGAGEAPQFALVELMGHRVLVGAVREVERFGAKMLRVDVPAVGACSASTSEFSPAAVYGVHYCGQAEAMHLLGDYGPRLRSDLRRYIAEQCEAPRALEVMAGEVHGEATSDYDVDGRRFDERGYDDIEPPI